MSWFSILSILHVCKCSIAISLMHSTPRTDIPHARLHLSCHLVLMMAHWITRKAFLWDDLMHIDWVICMWWHATKYCQKKNSSNLYTETAMFSFLQNSSLASPEVVILTASNAASYESFVEMVTFPLQFVLECYIVKQISYFCWYSIMWQIGWRSANINFLLKLYFYCHFGVSSWTRDCSG